MKWIVNAENTPKTLGRRNLLSNIISSAALTRAVGEKNGVRIRDMLEARGRRRAPPHAGSFGVDSRERAPQWAEGCDCAVRRDLPLRWTGPTENEVHEVPSQTYEHETFTWTHSLPRSFEDLLAHSPRVR